MPPLSDNNSKASALSMDDTSNTSNQQHATPDEPTFSESPTSPAPLVPIRAGGLIRPPPKKGDFKVSEFRFYVVCAMLISDAIASSMLFSYVGLFVAHIDPHFNRSSAGYVAGLLIGTFQAIQVFALPMWGRLSDRIGRKPVMLAASMLSVVASIAFGCSTSLGMALAMRGLHGAVAGGVATVKTFVFEVTDEHSQARGFGLMNLMWALGTFIGPSVGGFLYDINESPYFSQHLPRISLFDRYPALPPALAMSSYALFAGILAAMFIPESNPSTVPMSKVLQELKEWAKSFLVGRAHRSLLHPADDDDADEGEPFPEVSTTDSNAQQQNGASTTQETPASFDVDDNAPDGEDDGKSGSVKRAATAGLGPYAAQNMEIDEVNAKLNALPSISPAQVFTHPVLSLTIPMYMLLCSFVIAFDEVFPLYAIAYKEDGGLGFSSTQVGMAGMMNSLISVCANAILPWVSRRIPMMRMWTLCCIFSIFAFVAVGFFSYLSNPTWCLIALLPLFILRTTATTWAFATNLMFTANAAPKKHLGMVTTVTMASASVARSLTPIVAAPIFAWSISGGDAHWFPFNHFLLFFICVVLAFICIGLGRKVPEEVIRVRRA